MIDIKKSARKPGSAGKTAKRSKKPFDLRQLALTGRALPAGCRRSQEERP